MSQRPAKFRQIDVTRALRAAKAAGLVISGFEIDAEGKIVVVIPTGPMLPTAPNAVGEADRAFAEWEAKYGQT